MSLAEESRRDIVQYRMERAFTALEQAKGNLAMSYLEVTANRLYYAAHYAVSALLIAYKIPFHSHDGSITQFSQHFVKTNIVARDMGRLLNQLFTLRRTGDYSDKFNLTEEQITPMIEPTEEFIVKITSLAKKELCI